MARIRYIKPEFFEDQRIGKLSFQARLLFIGLWTLMDRGGLVECSAASIRAKVFPYDDFTLNQVEEMIGELVESGRITKVTCCDQELLYCPNFEKHQHFHPKEKPKFDKSRVVVPASGRTEASTGLDNVETLHSRPGTEISGTEISGTEISTARTRQVSDQVPSAEKLKSEIQDCIEAWKGTLRFFGAERGLLPDEERKLARGVQRNRFENALLAILGVREEKAGSDGFDPAQHLNLDRIFDPSKIGRFVSMGAKARNTQRAAAARAEQMAKLREAPPDETEGFVDPEKVRELIATRLGKGA